MSGEELRQLLEEQRRHAEEQRHHYEAFVEMQLEQHVGAVRDELRAMGDELKTRVGKIEHHLGLNGVSKPAKRRPKRK